MFSASELLCRLVIHRTKVMSTALMRCQKKGRIGPSPSRPSPKSQEPTISELYTWYIIVFSVKSILVGQRTCHAKAAILPNPTNISEA